MSLNSASLPTSPELTQQEEAAPSLIVQRDLQIEELKLKLQILEAENSCSKEAACESATEAQKVNQQLQLVSDEAARSAEALKSLRQDQATLEAIARASDERAVHRVAVLEEQKRTAAAEAAVARTEAAAAKAVAEVSEKESQAAQAQIKELENRAFPLTCLIFGRRWPTISLTPRLLLLQSRFLRS